MRILIACFLLMLIACNSRSYTWTQRMTVTVETPDGPVTGASVIEIRATYRENSGGLLGNEVHYRHSGEAVVVEVAPGQWLFALNDDPAELVYRASPNGLGGIPLHDRGRWLRAIPRARGEVMTLPEALYPRFVTFGDINDPLTADIFEAGEMAAIFGEGYAIVSVTVEVVEAPLAIGFIDNVLVWRCDYVDPYRRLDGNTGAIFGTSAPEILGPGAFVTELDDCQ